LRGAYQPVNERLHDVLGAFTDGEVRRLFAVAPIACPAPAAAPPPAPGAAAAAWEPPAELLRPERNDGELRARGEAQAGFVVTSYSAVKRRQGGFTPSVEAADDPASGEISPADADLAGPPDDELPRGRLSGAFLHECLEEV